MRQFLKLMIPITVLLLAGCANLPFGPQDTASEPVPTLDPASLSVTPYPTSTPQPTYTPYPTAVRVPTNTPYPTFSARINAVPTGEASATAAPVRSFAGGGGVEAAPAQPQPTIAPEATFQGYLGIPQASDDVPELEPIVEVLPRNATCGDEILVQLGVVNWGSAPAKDFIVEWSGGIDIESGTTHIDDLQWGNLPMYFRNKPIRYNCDEATNFTLYVRVDTANTVQEVYEDNNYKEVSFFLAYAPEN